MSGERQVLTIPEAQDDQNGTISCVAENTAGKATCIASLEVGKYTIFCRELNKFFLPYFFFFFNTFLWNGNSNFGFR